MLAAVGTLFYDEATTMECVTGQANEKHCGGHFGASMAYNRAAREGLVKVGACAWSKNDQKQSNSGNRDGSCIAEFL